MQINVESKIRNYEILIQNNFDFINELSSINPKVVILDNNVWNLYENLFLGSFKKEEVLLVEATEFNKTVEFALSLCDSVMRISARRNLTIVSIGGGIIQDITGFLASILYRGVNWIYIPTTLLAQADSCMGSKTSINYKIFKNLLGTFYPPTTVHLNVAFTKTLRDMDFYSGIGEVVKLHLMGGQHNIDLITLQIKEIQNQRDNDEFIRELVINSLNIKYSFIKDDEFDTGKRNMLNYGHCFGHALEVSSKYVIPHGIAVTVGMIFANIIAVKRGLLSKDIECSILNNILLHSFDYCFTIDLFSKDTILTALKMDKKRVGFGLPLIVLQNNLELTSLTDMTVDELIYGIDKVTDLLVRK
jgi:3-dehydroquinate synthase